MNPSPFLGTYTRYPLDIVRGEGSRLLASDGRWYLDAFTGIAVMALGHGHPEVRQAIHAQVDSLLHVSNLLGVGTQTEFASLLSEVYGGKVFLCNSGSEANEAAVKLVRKHFFRMDGPDRVEVLSAHGAFHGRTFMAMGLTPTPRYQEGYGPMPHGVRSVPVVELAGAVGPMTAAVIIEPVQGERGCHPVAQLAEIRAACDAHGALLIYDEVQCGLGRTGTFHTDPAPDIRTLAKALGGGLPLGAVVATGAAADAFQPGDHGSTFGGNPVSCAAGLATLRRILKDDLPANATRMGARLRAGLEQSGVKVTGEGLMLAAHLGKPAGPVVDGMRHAGVITCPAGAEAVRFLPALNVTEADIDQMVEAFAGALDADSPEQ